ncbi:MAG: M67 family metallopeptidase [Chryseolinea sp.]
MPTHQPLFIKQALIHKMIAHAESLTEECCGFLLGHDGETRTVAEVVPARNAATLNKEKQFSIEPLEYLKVENYADENSFELIGIYHSHPNHPAIPSEHDQRAAQPHFSYIILSLVNSKFHDIKSWRLDSNRNFIEELINQTIT